MQSRHPSEPVTGCEGWAGSLSGVVSPARTAPDVVPERASSPAPGPRRRAPLVLGLLAVAAAIAFPFAPVQQAEATYTWPVAGSAAPAAVPLMPYQPVRLTTSVSCAAARALDGPTERVLVATVPADPDPTAARLDGLRIAVADGTLRVRTAGVDLDPVPLPAGDCTVTLASDSRSTALDVGGHPLLTLPGDLRPAVTGVFTDATDATGMSLRLTADTRFQTVITPLKAAIAAVGVLAVLGMLVALARGERNARVRLLPRGWWRPRLPDLAVTVTLGVWWLIGPITVDDGYIAGIVRARGSSGFIGNVYRWLNAPEAPFSWFYDLYYAWSQVSTSTVWMRLPSVLLGLVCWGLISRLVVRRILPRAAQWVPWLAVLTVLVWWLPFMLGLRPEPWVAVGLLLVFLGVERGIATRRLTPLLLALLVAAVTTAVTPGGLMAFAPFVAGAVPVLRSLRAQASALGRVTLVVSLLAAPAAAVFLMLSDQSLASMLEATRIRTLIGGGQPWYEEYTRYSLLLQPGEFQGSLAKRAPVLLTLAAAAAVLWSTSRRGTGVAGVPAGPAQRVTVTFLLGLAAMTATPTKWTQHFGDVAGLGAAVLLLGIVTFSSESLRSRARPTAPWLIGLGVLTVGGSLVLAGYNIWPYVSDWWGLTWSTVTPLLAGIPVATLWLLVGGIGLALVLLRLAWRGSAGHPVDMPARVPPPGGVAVALVAAVVALQVLTFARTSIEHRDSYTLASDAVATAGGEPCGLQERLSVETDPGVGLLPEITPPLDPLPVRPVNVGGREIPGVAAAGSGQSAWSRLDETQRDGRLPVVVTVSGTLRAGDVLKAEFADTDRRVLTDPALSPSGGTPRDVRLMAPEGAEFVRLVADVPKPPQTGEALASLPRVPRLTPMGQVLPPGTEAILDWPVAFVFPCLTPAPLPLGTAGLPRWRVAPPQGDDAAGITYAPGFGGPFAAPRLLVTEQRMATYLDSDPIRDAAQVYRWQPLTPFVPLEPQLTWHTVPGWAGEGRIRVPGLDPVG